MHVLFVVVEPPAITESPLDQLAERGGNATFTCSARGFPCPTISWEHNMEPVSGNYAVVTDNCTNDTVTSMLTIRNVNSNDSGTFSCIAIVNPGGENNSLSITQTALLIVGKFRCKSARIRLMDFCLNLQVYLIILFQLW